MKTNISRLKTGTMILSGAMAALTAPILASCGNRGSNMSEYSAKINAKIEEIKQGNHGKPGDPQLGTPGGGPVFDKSGEDASGNDKGRITPLQTI